MTYQKNLIPIAHEHIDFELHLCTISNPRSRLTPGTALRAVGSGTMEVIKQFRSSQEDEVKIHLRSQGSVFSSVTKFSISQVNIIWSACQSKLPKNNFNFTIRYINNTLPTHRNHAKWGLSSIADCSFCLNPESLLHVLAGAAHI